MKSKGFSLIELVVAMAVSLLAILMLLMLFKQVIRVGMESTQDAELDHSLDTALLVIQKTVQNAGYGTGGIGDIAVSTIEGSDNIEVSALFWRLNTNDDFLLNPFKDTSSNIETETETETETQCWGISESVSNLSDENYLHQLFLLQWDSCGSTDDLKGNPTRWAVKDIIASFKTKQPTPIFSYEPVLLINESEKCSPYGIEDIKGSYKVVISAKVPDYKTTERSVCLTNISF